MSNKRRMRFGFSAVIFAAMTLACPGTAFSAESEIALTVSTSGTGTGTVQCKAGVGSFEPCEDEYPEGTELTLLAEADPSSEFVEWSGDCGPASCELTMDGPHSVTATFDLTAPALEFALTIKTNGTGTGTVRCAVGADPLEPCAAEYPAGTELWLEPVADPGSEFVHWSGDCSGVEECELTMDGPHGVTATFNLEPSTPEFAFTLHIKGTGSGSVQCEAQEGPQPCAAKYPEGTELALLAEPAPGSEFAGWSGSGCSGTGSCEVTMSAAKTVTATFNLEPPGFEYSLAVEGIGTGNGTVTSSPGSIDCGSVCADDFLEGTKVILTATAEEGSIFDHWSGGGCSGSEPCKLTMNSSRNVKAVFAATGQRTLTVDRAGTGTGSVMSSPGGIDCGSSCAAAYAVGTKVTLEAKAAEGSTFTGWSGACSGTGTCAVTLDEARSVTAAFEGIPKSKPSAGKLVVAGVAKVKKGRALLRISCKGPEACVGAMRLVAKLEIGNGKASNVAIGRASFGLAPGVSTMLAIKLGRRARLPSARGLKVRVTGGGVQACTVRLR